MRGSLRLTGPSADATILERVESWLAGQHKSVSYDEFGTVVFSARLWPGLDDSNSWIELAIYDRGRFWLERNHNGLTLRYDLRSLHGFVFCLLAAGLFFGAGVFNEGLLLGIRYAAFAFGWLYGMNMALAWFRIPRAIRKAVLPPSTKPRSS